MYPAGGLSLLPAYGVLPPDPLAPPLLASVGPAEDRRLVARKDASPQRVVGERCTARLVTVCRPSEGHYFAARVG
jgi:hypothetical protein